ncbi:serine-type D-Ala-D-Ala carboxypeptidase [Leptospira ryugenii]|uniref:Serine-type D-Ala-D-Ala carboxypeptidase n=1 Tax=Leptospira ryugenii TaxID=1917863 RepID=A0A2P2E476_9LEPT|nr:M15 family metallopeptidase [Leptospira ryugenii]GBF51688.1 serine-type D-Ala-D-Ala carboxypeptidase [Leptospira ryugenii]
MKRIHISSFSFLFLISTSIHLSAQSKNQESLYLKLNPFEYLMGKYNANQGLIPIQLEENQKDHFLRPEVKSALLKMIDAFEDSKPASYKQEIFLVSSFRNFNQQKQIWESKFTGKKAMRVPIKDKTPAEIIALILEFSSAPGTSRHHWGTDFDLNALDNGYFEGNGRGKILYDWLQKNAHLYGFCQPYNELAKRGGKGYQEEKWHWSYAPIAQNLQAAWLKAYSEKKISISGSFLGSEELGDKSVEFVRSINSDCDKIAKQFN